ncbi:MAG: MFS transporter, partial [Syntrophales bacterium]|nr:MFS transporter [Syntrophales bacterium]
AIFYLRIPFGILAALIAFLLLRQDPVRPGRIRLDLWGTITSFAGLLLLLLGMGQVKGRGLMSAVVIGLVAAGLLLLVLFLIIEKRAEEPILSFELFRNRAFTFSLSGLFLYFMTVPPVYALIMPFYFMESIHMPPRTAGLVLSVIPAVNMIASPVSGFLSDRFGPKRLSSLGAAMMTAAFCLMFRFGPHTGIGEVVPVLILLGAGMGIFLPPNSSAIMGGVDKERLGSASALIGTSRQVACAIGMTVMGAVFSAGREASDRLREATVSAFLDVALVTAFLMAAVLILSLAAPGRAPRQKAHEIASEPDSTQAGRDIRA